ncbi:MAG: RDD family protein [Acholeplasmatales bacterium]|nr:RDD family protein [Acholeplasmatales bacterium]
MQLYNRATSGQRFLAFLIDLLVVGAVVGSISLLILFLTGFDFVAFSQAQDEYLTDYLLYIQTNSSEYYDSFQKALQEYYSYSVHLYLVIDLVALVLFIPYFVILPHYWSKQTVGRMAMKIKVISHKGKVKATVKQLIIREIVGTWFIYLGSYFLFSGFIIVVSGVFAAIGGRSVVDIISGTDLVQKDPITVDPEAFKQTFGFNDPRNPESQFDPEKEGFRKDDSIDAETKDVTNDNDSYSVDNDTVDNNDYNEGSNESKDDSDDEYQVF